MDEQTINENVNSSQIYTNPKLSIKNVQKKSVEFLKEHKSIFQSSTALAFLTYLVQIGAISLNKEIKWDNVKHVMTTLSSLSKFPIKNLHQGLEFLKQPGVIDDLLISSQILKLGVQASKNIVHDLNIVHHIKEIKKSIAKPIEKSKQELAKKGMSVGVIVLFLGHDVNISNGISINNLPHSLKHFEKDLNTMNMNSIVHSNIMNSYMREIINSDVANLSKLSYWNPMNYIEHVKKIIKEKHPLYLPTNNHLAYDGANIKNEMNER